MDVMHLKQGNSPLLISMPHSGTILPDEIACRMEKSARSLPDTDWHLKALYGFLTDLDVTVISGHLSRYVVDLNREINGSPLYPGALETTLCPLTQFNGANLYKSGLEPSVEEISLRTEAYWKPYHAALRTELNRLKAIHGYVILMDAHSIKSNVPELFDGKLPDFNMGTFGGKSCHPELSRQIMSVLNRHSDYSSVLDGRFKGGYITRHYGKPEESVYSFQIELSQNVYMDENDPVSGLSDDARATIKILQEIVSVAKAFQG